MSNITKAEQDVLNERHRQVFSEGWDSKHDDEHENGEIALAAICYASPVEIKAHLEYEIPCGCREACCPHSAFPRTKKKWAFPWPWDASWWKPKNRRRDLVRAGALIIAEIERLDRLSAKPE